MTYKEMTNHELFSMCRRGYAWLKWHKPETDKKYKADLNYQKIEAGYKLIVLEAWNRGMPEVSLRNYNADKTPCEELSDEELACIFGSMPIKPLPKKVYCNW